jgi:hypothetical protein
MSIESVQTAVGSLMNVYRECPNGSGEFNECLSRVSKLRYNRTKLSGTPREALSAFTLLTAVRNKHNYNFACCFVWVRNLVADKGGT